MISFVWLVGCSLETPEETGTRVDSDVRVDCSVEPCACGVAFDGAGRTFGTLQDAFASGADELHICAGEYDDGPWLISGPVALIGSAREETFLEQQLIILGDQHVTISSLTVRYSRLNEPKLMGIEGAALKLSGFASVSLDDVELAFNRADYGGAIDMGGSSYVEVRNSYIHDNTAECGSEANGHCGGGAFVYENATLVSSDTNWGVGGHDNAPNDVTVAGDSLPAVQSYSFGDAASFTCHAATITCN